MSRYLLLLFIGFPLVLQCQIKNDLYYMNDDLHTNTLTEKLITVYKSKLDILDKIMNIGAKDFEIKELEKFVEQKLPNSYIKLLEKYNGEKKVFNFMGGFSFSSIKDVKQDWIFFQQAPKDVIPAGINQEKKIKNILYSTKRIPFAHDGSGNFLCLDFCPNFDGKLGQILYLPSGDPEPISVIADSFDDFLNLIINKIESEKLKLIDERSDWDNKDWEKADIYMFKTWKNDWSDIAEEYNLKCKNIADK